MIMHTCTYMATVDVLYIYSYCTVYIPHGNVFVSPTELKMRFQLSMKAKSLSGNCLFQ